MLGERRPSFLGDATALSLLERLEAAIVAT